MAFAFTNPFLSFLEPRRWAESIIAINEPFCVQETSHFNFRHGVFDTRIFEFLFRTENYELSFFFLLQKHLGHKSMEKINVACTQICFIFLFVLFKNIGELASKAWEKKRKNVCRYLWEKRGLLSHSFMLTSHHYHLYVHGTNRIGPVELEI